MKRILTLGILTLVVGFVVIQLLPYGRNHTNFPVQAEPQWDSPHTRQLASVACFDCHSGATVWPWYSNVAPVSWLLQRDVDKGRSELDFFDLTTRTRKAGEAAESVQEGHMPPRIYTVMHPEANLSLLDRTALIQGLQKTLGVSERGSSGRRESESR